MIDNRICLLYKNIFVDHFFSLTINCMEQHSGPGIYQQREQKIKNCRWLISWIFGWQRKRNQGSRCWEWKMDNQREGDTENIKAKILLTLTHSPWQTWTKKKIAALKWNKLFPALFCRIFFKHDWLITLPSIIVFPVFVFVVVYIINVYDKTSNVFQNSARINGKIIHLFPILLVDWQHFMFAT